MPQLMTIPGTDGAKMSKSYGNTIDIFLPEKELLKAIKTIISDSTPLEAPKNPDTDVTFKLYSLLATPAETATMRASYEAGGYGYGHAKKELYELILRRFATEREQFDFYMNNLPELDAAAGHRGEAGAGIRRRRAGQSAPEGGLRSVSKHARAELVAASAHATVNNYLGGREAATSSAQRASSLQRLLGRKAEAHFAAPAHLLVFHLLLDADFLNFGQRRGNEVVVDGGNHGAFHEQAHGVRA